MLANLGVIQPDIIMDKNKNFITSLLTPQQRPSCKSSLYRGIKDLGQAARILELDNASIDYIKLCLACWPANLDRPQPIERKSKGRT